MITMSSRKTTLLLLSHMQMSVLLAILLLVPALPYRQIQDDNSPVIIKLMAYYAVLQIKYV